MHASYCTYFVFVANFQITWEVSFVLRYLPSSFRNNSYFLLVEIYYTRMNSTTLSLFVVEYLNIVFSLLLTSFSVGFFFEQIFVKILELRVVDCLYWKKDFSSISDMSVAMKNNLNDSKFSKINLKMILIFFQILQNSIFSTNTFFIDSLNFSFNFCVSAYLFYKIIGVSLFILICFLEFFAGLPFVCPNACGRQYKYKQGLQQHLKYECGHEKQFKCTECPRAFHHRKSLKNHLGIVHKKIVWKWTILFDFFRCESSNVNIVFLLVYYFYGFIN